MTSRHICLLKQKKLFALKKSLTKTELIYSSNMANSLLFRSSNMADVTSCEHILSARGKENGNMVHRAIALSTFTFIQLCTISNSTINRRYRYLQFTVNLQN